MADAELAELRKQCITSLYLCTDNVSKYVDNDKDESFCKLKNHVQEYCLLEAQQKVAFDALDMAKRETTASNIDSLQDRFSVNLNNLAGKRLDVNRHPFMVEINKRIAKGNHNLTAAALDESDLAITETQEVYKDPITKRSIQEPLKNSVCGHIYERNTILNLIETKGNRAKCPVVGCGNRGPLTKNQLVTDEELIFRMALTQHSTMIQDRSVMDLDD